MTNSEETTAVNCTDDGWRSRKFWVANGSAFAVLAFSFVARWAGKIEESTLQYLVTVALAAIAIYCGFNIADRFARVKAMVGGILTQSPTK